MVKNLIRIGCNYNSKGTRLENLIEVFNEGQKFATFVSSVSARKLKCPSRLEPENFSSNSSLLDTY